MLPRPAALLLLVLLLAGCGEAAAPAAPPDAVRQAPSARQQPLDLVGRWFVDAPGIEPRTVLLLGSELVVFLACGTQFGSWRADAEQGLFVSSVHGGSQACRSPETPRWLAGAVRFRTLGDQRELLDPDGTRTALLRPGATPTAGPDMAPELAAEPVVTEDLRVMAAVPPPLPAGVAAPTAAQVERRWVASGRRGTGPEQPFLEFADDRWHGSDGCNGHGGAWRLGERGRVVATAGPTTLIGCDNSSVTSLPAEAARVGLVDGALVFYGEDAQELGRVVPD